MIRVAMVVLAALALLVNLAAAEEQGAAGRDTADGLSVILNLYDLGRDPASTIEVLSPHVRPTDVFNLVSGNRRGQADLVSINRWATILHERFPKNDIWAMTSGLANVKLLAEGRKKIPTCVTTIVYDYEPNWENEPEFDWDFARTIANYQEAVRLAHGGGFRLIGAPTGRPLLQESLKRHAWDYARLARESAADGMLVQTQTYAKKDVATFKSAMEKLKQQQSAADLGLKQVYPQVTVDQKSPNGVPVEQAVMCAREAARIGFDRVSLWFAPQGLEDATRFLIGWRVRRE